MDEWIKVISQVGFPIAVSAYLLIRLEVIIKELTQTLNKLIITLARHGIDIENRDDKR
jgi:hypothetical protein